MEEIEGRTCPGCGNPVGRGDQACMICGRRLDPSCAMCGSTRVKIAQRLSPLGRRAFMAGVVLLPLFGVGLILILLALSFVRRDLRCLACGEEYALDESV